MVTSWKTIVQWHNQDTDIDMIQIQNISVDLCPGSPFLGQMIRVMIWLSSAISCNIFVLSEQFKCTFLAPKVNLLTKCSGDSQMGII